MLNLFINGIGSDMQGVGRLPDGRAVFVQGAIPGETVQIEIIKDKARYCEATLLDVLEPSPDRVNSDCPFAGRCGGCQSRHIRYERTLDLKRQIVYDALTRIGGIVDPQVHTTIGCSVPNRARNKAEYPIGFQNGHYAIGAYTGGSREIISLDDCLLQHSLSIQLLRWFASHLCELPCASHIKGLVTRVTRQGELMGIVCTDAPVQAQLYHIVPAICKKLSELKSLYLCHLNRRPAHALDGRCIHIWGKRVLVETLFGLSFEVSPMSFFQVNPGQTESLYSSALEAAEIKPGCNYTILDAYCGAGTITLAAALWANAAVGIEIVHSAIENAKRNAVQNNLADKTRFFCGDAAKEVPLLLTKGEHFDAVILDPPRKGADESLLKAIAAAHIPRISYVSCNPATLARDVKLLHTLGYSLQWAQPVDMFPYTGHIESVVKLTRAGF